MSNAKTIDIPKLPLVLKRETLRTLTPDQLGAAVGGVNRPPPFRSDGCY